MALLFNIKKVNALPQTLTADTLYFVMNGDGFDLYLSNKTGTEVRTLNQPAVEAGVDQFLLMGVGLDG